MCIRDRSGRGDITPRCNLSRAFHDPARAFDGFVEASALGCDAGCVPESLETPRWAPPGKGS
eukprot:1832143-Alexandrium_andersonii.AAC.1